MRGGVGWDWMGVREGGRSWKTAFTVILDLLMREETRAPLIPQDYTF